MRDQDGHLTSATLITYAIWLNVEVSLEHMKALVENPKFVCKKCGRVTAKEGNLCEPVPL
ncbi:hypothetical protein MUP79_07925 [Candidatus Bathyarchaeota archaeon]|nr:hypothetical protein [Candidatus Bathyarchaeota archaeon]